MKKNLFIILLALIIIVTIFIPSKTYAYGDEGHNRVFEQILFGESFNISNLNKTQKIKLQALEAASYLALDQFNGKGKDQLIILQNRKVWNLPESIDDINFEGNQYHRQYTHKGWDYNYNPDTAKFKKYRKKILLNTTKKELSFGITSNFGFTGYTDQCESFAAFIYYIHILGDYLVAGDSNASSGNIKLYTKNDQDLGDMIDFINNSDNNLVSEINKHLLVIFKDQKEVDKLVKELDEIGRKAKKIYNSVDGSEIRGESFDAMYEYVKEYRNTLKKYVPDMLQKEPFFNNVFSLEI